MKGYRTLATNVVSLLAAAAVIFGIEITAEDQATVVAGILAVVNVANILLRLDTTGPVPFQRRTPT